MTNILLGRQTPQVLERGHERLTVFGLMPEASIDELRGYIDQLLGADLLRAGGDAYPILQLTSGGVALLKDAAACHGLVLARQQKPERRAAARQAADGESWVGVDRQLFDRLRAFRHEIARTRHVPPYVVFHDATLREIARLKPSTMSGLRQVYGIGTRKAEDLGEAILDVIRAQHS